MDPYNFDNPDWVPHYDNGPDWLSQAIDYDASKSKPPAAALEEQTVGIG
jgi:hypothetical protein